MRCANPSHPPRRLRPTALSLGVKLLLVATPGLALAAPDLRIQGGLEANDRVADSGDRVTVEYTASNAGDQDVEDPRVGFYLSTDAAFSADDVFMAAEDLSDLDAGESDDESEQFALPGIADGEYHVLLVIDDLDWVAESDEGNNVSASPITIGSGGGGGDGVPDLVIDSDRMSYTVFDGGATLVVDYVVENRGDGPVENALLDLYLSDDGILSDDDRYLRWDDADAVAAGSSVYEDAFVDVPPELPSGTYYVLVQADPEDQVAELDETNNVGALAFEHVSIGGGGDVDLVADSLSVPWRQQRRQPGQTLDISYRLRNGGADASGSFDYTVYLVDRSTTPAGYSVLQSRSSNGLSGGQTLDGSFSTSLPASLSAGTYDLELVVDGDDRIGETDESNNSVRQAIKVSSGGWGR